MSHEERNDLIELRRFLTNALEEINEQLIAYPPAARDDDFDFLIKKAKSYRDLLPRVEQRMNMANPVPQIVNAYYAQLANAGSADEKQAIAQEYHAYYNRLSDADKAEAKQVMRSKAAALRQRLEQFEPLVERGKAILAKYASEENG